MSSDGVGEVWTIVVAGGTGRRFGGLKQYELLSGRSVLERSVDRAREASAGVVVVLPPHDAGAPGTVAGGSTRSESVRNGLAAVPESATIVLVHDAARPFASAGLYARVIAAVRAGAAGAIPGVAVTDTIKVVETVDGVRTVVDTPDRSTLVAVQTPQGFEAAALRSAHAAGGEGTDDASLVEAAGGRIVVVEGEVMNRKITHTEDLEWARQYAKVVG
ncbi:MAG: 2-C-methyl-D-erythritol 4-phosphate cytidylyltransferase [Ilumatobacteraceae bacterium]